MCEVNPFTHLSFVLLRCPQLRQQTSLVRFPSKSAFTLLLYPSKNSVCRRATKYSCASSCLPFVRHLLTFETCVVSSWGSQQQLLPRQPPDEGLPEDEYEDDNFRSCFSTHLHVLDCVFNFTGVRFGLTASLPLPLFVPPSSFPSTEEARRTDGRDEDSKTCSVALAKHVLPWFRKPRASHSIMVIFGEGGSAQGVCWQR